MISNLLPRIHPNLVNFVRPSPHSTFSPSAAERWMQCGYSIAASKDIPEEKSKYSDEGTLAHSVCEAVFRLEFYGLEFDPQFQMELAMWERNNPGSTQEMMDHAHTYVNVISHYLNSGVLGTIIWFGLEKGVPIFPEKGCFGTGDCIIVGTLGCAVIDYKYGKGKNVDPTTLQLQVYMVGILRHLSEIPQGYTFHAVIVQPRIVLHPKTHIYFTHEISSCAEMVWQAILRAEQTGLQPVEGNHCYWCPAKRTKDPELKCGAIKNKAVTLAQENFGKFLADMNAPVADIDAPNTKRDEALIKLMALKPLIDHVVANATEEFEYRTAKGEVIPGVRIVTKEGKRELAGENDDKIAELITSKFKVNPWRVIPATRKIRTLSDLEKEIGKSQIDSICTKKITKHVEILDEKTSAILGDMAKFGSMITNNGEGQEE